MWDESIVFKEDMEQICSSSFIPWEKLRGKKLLVSGATGIIGLSLIHALLYANQVRGLKLRIYALVRNEEKAKNLFKNALDKDISLKLVKHDVQNALFLEEDIDYIVHGAAPTSSTFFVKHPVETVQTIVSGTMNLLKFAQEKQVQGFLFLSTMEVYGHPPKGEKVTEDVVGTFSALQARNSYPLSKQLCENLCYAYAQEYQLPAVILRLTQTFGPGVDYHDGRIFAEFARCCINRQNIVLKTEGKTERSYLYTADAVSAILTALLKGIPGEAYTAANESTYCTIFEMAKLVAKQFRIDVEVKKQDVSKLGYAGTLYVDLDTTKLKSLGWSAETNLIEMYVRMIESMVVT